MFVDTDSDVRLARRLKRDITDRGRDIHGVLQQYEQFVKPSFETFIGPSKRHADIVVPRGAENTVAIELIAQHINSLLIEREAAEATRREAEAAAPAAKPTTPRTVDSLYAPAPAPKRKRRTKKLPPPIEPAAKAKLVRVLASEPFFRMNFARPMATRAGT